jgi:hypothetical protein
MIVGEWSGGGRRPQKMAGVNAGPGDVAQPFGELWQEWVPPGAGGFCSDQLPPLPFGTGVCGRESHVELELEDSAGPAELGWAGGSQVAGVDLGCGPPYLYVGDQLGWHWNMALGRPGRRCSCRVEAELVGEHSNKL